MRAKRHAAEQRPERAADAGDGEIRADAPAADVGRIDVRLGRDIAELQAEQAKAGAGDQRDQCQRAAGPERRSRSRSGWRRRTGSAPAESRSWSRNAHRQQTGQRAAELEQRGCDGGLLDR